MTKTERDNFIPTAAQNLPPAFSMSEDELLAVLESSLYPGARRESIKLVVGWCKATSKDPMKRPVHIVPMSVKKAGTRDDYEWRDVIMEGIGSLRTDAMRTGCFAGLSEAEFGPEKILAIGETKVAYPEWCEIKAYRFVGGEKCEFSSGKVRWLETYGTAKRDSLAPNAMWKKRPYGQLEKCAEAMALRRAFPEIGAAPTNDEMAGKTIGDDDAIEGIATEKHEIRMPQPKQAARTEAPTAPPSPPDDAPAESAPKPADRPAKVQPPAAAPDAGDGKHATDGEKKWITNQLAALSIDLEAAMDACGITSFDTLSPDGFIAMKEWISAEKKSRSA